MPECSCWFDRSDRSRQRPICAGRGPGGPRLPAARPAPLGPARLQRPRLPRLVPGPGRLPPVAVRLRLQGRPRGAHRRPSSLEPTSRTRPTASCSTSRRTQTSTAAASGWRSAAGSTTCSGGGSRRALRRQGRRRRSCEARGHAARGRLLGRRRACRLRIVAHWSDGSAEDVTPLCRYQTNDESIAEVDADGVVTEQGPGRHARRRLLRQRRGGRPGPAARLREASAPRYPDVPTPTKIDELVVAKLRKLGIVPSELCSDAEFLRRVSLDMTGTLPTPRRGRGVPGRPVARQAGGEDRRAARRGRPTPPAGRRSCATSPATRRATSRTRHRPRSTRGNWYEWIARRVRENVPYDELVAGIVLGRSRQPGQSYRGLHRGGVGLLPRAGTRPTSPPARRCPTTGPSTPRARPRSGH